jgi:hypothetical protein
MITVNLLLLVLSFVAFAIAAVGISTRVNLLALGLALLVLSMLLHA